MSDVILDFLKEAKRAKKTRAEAIAALVEAGWPEADIAKVTATHLDSDFPVLVPRPKLYVSSRMTALNLTYFISFVIVLVCGVSIFFTFLDYHLPDGLGRMQGSYYNSAHTLGEEMRCYLSTLIAALPFLAGAACLIRRSIQRTHQATPRIRLWLIYGLLSAGACTSLINLALLVNYILEGQLSLRFMLKIIFLSGIFAGVFAYFRPEITTSEKQA